MVSAEPEVAAWLDAEALEAAIASEARFRAVETADLTERFLARLFTLCLCLFSADLCVAIEKLQPDKSETKTPKGYHRLFLCAIMGKGFFQPFEMLPSAPNRYCLFTKQEIDTVMAKLYYDTDANQELLAAKTLAVFGYGSQGHAQACNMRDSGVKVIIGLREGGSSAEKAREDGFEVCGFAEAASKADIIHFLLPDERHKEVFAQIESCLSPGKVLSCSHGLNFHFGIISPPEGVDVIMVAPKAPGPTVRREYLNNYGVPALVAVHTDASGNALQIALAMAKANGNTRVGCFETTFKDETETDLFGEQTVICGGVVYLMKAAFETLVEAGYPPEIAYFECLHEMKLIVDLVYKGGVSGMSKKISNTAAYGQFSRGPRIVSDGVKKAMKECLAEIQDGRFVKEWIEGEFVEKKLSTLKAATEDCLEWPIEKAGREIRQMAGLEEVQTGEE